MEPRDRIRTTGVIAILRARSPEGLIEAAKAIQAGGIDVIEVSMTTPGALGVIAQVSKQLGDRALFGVGTVLDAPMAEEAIRLGAEFLVSPTLSSETINVCKRGSKLAIAGCLTPTEILRAWEMGADFVKIFPANLGGPTFIRTVRGPLPRIPLIPTGGVTLETTGAYLEAGAAAVAVGSSLLSEKILAEKSFDLLTERARAFVREVEKARPITDT